MVGKTQCKVARRMAQWASLQDNEQQQGAGASNTPVKHNGPSSNDEILSVPSTLHYDEEG